MHVNGDIFGHHLLGERNEALGDVAKHDSRVGGGVDVRELEDEFGRRRNAAAHGHAEEVLLRLHVPQHRGWGDTQLRGDVRQGRSLEPLCREDPSRRIQQLVP